uniref:Galanin peptides-like n=1 Tax=Poecilia latipinna TaxID=48699 RepID=A0A3B3UDG8_9TELE
MQRCFGVFCVTLIFCATLSETIGLVIAAKEKRGWTLNSAGYLLGPRRIDHLIQIKDSPSARGRDELVTQCKIETYGRCRALAPGQELLFKMGIEESLKKRPGLNKYTSFINRKDVSAISPFPRK